jgi:type IV secretion system protein VirB10
MNLNDDNFNVDNEPRSLKERIGDKTVERGIPTELNVKKKRTMATVGFFLAAMVVMAVAVGGILSFTGGEDEAAVQTEENSISGQTGRKDLEAEKQDLLETVDNRPASDVAAPEPQPQPASEAVAPAEPVEPVAASEPAPDERFDSSLTPVGLNGDSPISLSGSSEENRPEGGSGSIGSMDETAGTDSGNPLTAKLRPGVYRATQAEDRGDPTYLMSRGTGISCVTTTKIVTTHPGLVRCQITKDVYSADGSTLLVERGSTVIGEQTSALTQGQARVFALWNTLETPEGIRVALDSPGGDPLGASGHPAKVKHHFWQRIGGAVMISMIQDVVNGANNRRSNKGTEVSFETTTESAQDIATEILKNSINIPPTGYVNQGTEIMIFVARDVDFSGVYENVTVSNRY